jgi:phosphatidylserine decarboxylase
MTSHLINFGIEAQRVLPSFVTTNFTTNICKKMGLRRDLEAKINFAKEYNIDWTTSRKCQDVDSLEQCAAKFPTLNDFFAREIMPEFTKPETTRIGAIVSPAECHARRLVSTNELFEIKGARYNLGTLLNIDVVPKAAAVFIFRLAPEQYHRFHSPINSTVVSVRSSGGEYKSVNPILLDRIPVLQKNYRKIIAFENGMYLVCVGATCVGSVNLSVKKGSRVVHGQDIGSFAFGGSCLVLVVPEGCKISKFNTKITANESLLTVGKWIADFTVGGSRRQTRRIKRAAD